jgi:protein phosphatase
VLLCSDGLHGVLSDGQIADTLRSPGTLEEKVRTLVDMARRKGGPDNITAVLIEAH